MAHERYIAFATTGERDSQGKHAEQDPRVWYVIYEGQRGEDMQDVREAAKEKIIATTKHPTTRVHLLNSVVIVSRTGATQYTPFRWYRHNYWPS